MPHYRAGRTTRLAVVLIAALSAVAASIGLGLSAAPTAAAGTCSGDPVTKTWRTPKETKLGVSQAKTVQLIAATKTSCSVKSIKVTVGSPLLDDTFSMAKYATQDDRDYWGVTYTVSPLSVYDLEAGSWSTSYAVKRGSGPFTHHSATFRILRAARLTTDAHPEPVTKGAELTVTGSLKRADWESQKYTGFAGQKVELQHRSGTGDYRRIATATSDQDGALRASVKATADGCYRYRFTGTTTTGSTTSRPDCVDVR